MAEFGNSKESTEHSARGLAYKWIKTKLLEIQDLLKVNSQINNEQNVKHKKLIEKLTKVIKTFEEIDEALKEDKSQYIEKEIILKSEIERLNAKLKLKELEYQQITVELNNIKDGIKHTKRLTKERLNVIKNYVLESFNSKNEDILSKYLNFIITKINSFLKDYAEEKSERECEQELMEAIANKYQKELSQYTLSQREKIVFNYIHQAEKQDNLRDVCLDDLLKIPSKPSNRESSNEDISSRIREIKRVICSFGKPKDTQRRIEYEKFIRICCSRSAIIINKYNELCESEESENSDVILLSDISDLDESSRILAKESKSKQQAKESVVPITKNRPVELNNKSPKVNTQQKIIDQRMNRIKNPQLQIKNTGFNIPNTMLGPQSNKLPNCQGAKNNMRSNPSESSGCSDRSTVLQSILRNARNVNSIRSVQNESYCLPQANSNNPYKSFILQRTSSKSNLPLKRPVPELIISKSKKVLARQNGYYLEGNSSRSSSVKTKNLLNYHSKIVSPKLKLVNEVKRVEQSIGSMDRKINSQVSRKVPVVVNSAQRKVNGPFTPSMCRYGNVAFSIPHPIRKAKKDGKK